MFVALGIQHAKRMLHIVIGDMSGSTQLSNLMKIRPVGAEFFHADVQTDRRDKGNSRFSQFYERA